MAAGPMHEDALRSQIDDRIGPGEGAAADPAQSKEMHVTSSAERPRLRRGDPETRILGVLSSARIDAGQSARSLIALSCSPNESGLRPSRAAAARGCLRWGAHVVRVSGRKLGMEEPLCLLPVGRPG